MFVQKTSKLFSGVRFFMLFFFLFVRSLEDISSLQMLLPQSR